MHPTLADWIAREAIPFSLDLPRTFDAAVAGLIGSLDDSVELLGFGEALHGGADVLALCNRLFQRLVEGHGFAAIAVESSFPRSHLVNEWVTGHGPDSYEELRETGFSHGFGRLQGNAELLEWMRQYNAEPSHSVRLRFYGFDSPTEMMFADSPRHVLHFVLDYRTALDSTDSRERQERIDRLLGRDSDWENPDAALDPTRAVGTSPEATALRVETEGLISELQVRRPELVAAGGKGGYLQAVQYASVARQLLSYPAALASGSSDRLVRLLGIRDAMMADNLVYAVSCERGRGKVLAFAHNSHLKLGTSQWQLGGDLLTCWPAGAHVNVMLGYAVVGTAVGVSDADGIGLPEPGTLEARLMAAPGPARFIPTHRGEGLAPSEVAALASRSGSSRNTTYFPLTLTSLADFDWLAVLDSTGYDPGAPPLQH